MSPPTKKTGGKDQHRCYAESVTDITTWNNERKDTSKDNTEN